VKLIPSGFELPAGHEFAALFGLIFSANATVETLSTSLDYRGWIQAEGGRIVGFAESDMGGLSDRRHSYVAAGVLAPLLLVVTALRLSASMGSTSS
jgi:hypothetical protein